MLPVNGSLRMAPLFPRSGPGESGSPMSQVLLRCYDFPPRISGHLFASLPGSTRSSSVRVSQLALPEGRRASGPGHLFNRRPNLPVCLHVDVSGTSQVPRRSIPCLCPALRPRPNRRSLASLTVASVLPPRFPRRRLQRFMNFGAQLRGFGTCCLRFKSDVATTPARLASGWLARLYREGVDPSGSLQKVSDHSSSFSGFILAQGKFQHDIALPERLCAQASTPLHAPREPRRPRPSPLAHGCSACRVGAMQEQQGRAAETPWLTETPGDGQLPSASPPQKP